MFLYIYNARFYIRMSEDTLLGLSGIAILFTIVILLTPGFISQFALALSQNTTATAPTNNFQTYSNPTFGIKMQYPLNWLKQDLSSNSSSARLIVVFRSPGAQVGLLNILLRM